MVLLFLIKSSPDSEEMKKIKKAAVKQLVNIRISATTSRLTESMRAWPFEKSQSTKWLCETVTAGNINILYYNIIC
jgi:hypothetical protein